MKSGHLTEGKTSNWGINGECWEGSRAAGDKTLLKIIIKGFSGAFGADYNR
ncbi:hypothetical protein Q7C_833 [Methylophaga frappieri]|uniref:Uncharacterized protein n=1 Tax=Methylophaga frappieri (strain ATCC BAA-2434 / DSM 25690 / JAM7) TaxID=754477 RepID=I1YGF9_METFJ|nr:hypothetical protein Q7C_833 [Methylophaga frappieri]